MASPAAVAERVTPVSIGPRRLSAGDWVEVRSGDEILGTLDGGALDGVPFMPEMFQYCGQRFQVFKRAHKTCDTVHRTGGRYLDRAVHLDDVRCDGRAHGGCDAACLVFWREEWLRPVDGPADTAADEAPPAGQLADAVWAATHAPGSTDGEPIYSCQATALPDFTTGANWWDPRQYVEDLASRNVGPWEMLKGAAYVVFFAFTKVLWRLRGHRVCLAAYDRFQRLIGGVPYPRRWGRIPAGQKTPGVSLGLEPGELVRVRSYDEILATLDTSNRNRGLFFDAEEVPYCGKTVRVRSRVNQIIDERTGRMIRIGGNTVILDDVYCMGHYSDRRMFCPRAIYSFWRETWLERIDGGRKEESAR